MILYKFMNNSAHYPISALKCSLLLIPIFSYQISAMSRASLPPIDMALITPTWIHNINQWLPNFLGSSFVQTPEIITLLRSIVNGEKTVEDPVCRKKLKFVYDKCTSEVLKLLLSKGMVFKDDCAHLLAIGQGSENYCLPDRLENMRILLKTGYQLDIKYDWQKKIILYLCACYSKDDSAPERRKDGDVYVYQAISRMYQELSRILLKFSDLNASHVQGCTLLCTIISRPWDYNGVPPILEKKICLLLKALWACGADPKNICEWARTLAQRNRMHSMLKTVDSIDANKAAIFHAIEQRDSAALKKLAQCTPFLVKNAEGDNPLHVAIKKASNVTGPESEQSIEIIGIILRILPQLISDKNSKERCTPFMLIIGSGAKRFLLDYFKKLVGLDIKSAPV